MVLLYSKNQQDKMNKPNLKEVYFFLIGATKKLYKLSLLTFKTSILKIIIKKSLFTTVYLNKGANIRLFNLDLHSSVIEDISKGLTLLEEDIELVRWSISGRNKISRKFLNIPDPIEYINHANWSALSKDRIEKFNSKYENFLKQFDGFIVTHTPSFVQVFESYNRPILLINSTRYEAPYSNNPKKWNELDHTLRDLWSSSSLTLVSNNRGDQEYLFQKTSIRSQVFPSVCDYIPNFPGPKSSEIIIFARSKELQKKIISSSSLNLQPSYDRFIPYSRICSSLAILIIPQNVSTMMLFELATLGIPVIVPSPKLINAIIHDGFSVLSELSHFQIFGLSTINLEDKDLNNYNSQHFYSSWLKFADFYDLKLMPNIIVIDNFSDLNNLDFTKIRSSINIHSRNCSLIEMRRELLRGFLANI